MLNLIFFNYPTEKSQIHILHSFAFTKKKDVLITNALVVLFYKMSIIVPEAILQLHMKGVFEHSMKAFALPFLSKDWSLLQVGL